jgi:aspartyl-tRNA(Asn)/glutamyl-tRNA(Gln) amidotransferase subunit A
LTIHELHDRLRRRELSARDLTRSVFDRIIATEERVRSFITLCQDTAVAQADDADRRFSQGDGINPLLGIPIALKDIFLTR